MLTMKCLNWSHFLLPSCIALLLTATSSFSSAKLALQADADYLATNQTVSSENLLPVANHESSSDEYGQLQHRRMARQAPEDATPSMVTVDSNTLPSNGSNTPMPIPHPESVDECDKQWEEYFSKKSAKQEELNCCFQQKNCECRKSFCKGDDKDNPACKHCEPKDCPKTGKITLEECMALPELSPRGTVAGISWLWILIAIAVIIVLCIGVAIFCVYRKKFCMHESKRDSKHAQVRFGGSMNVDSKVHWSGKHKGSRRTGSRGRIAGAGGSLPRRASGSRPNVSRNASMQIQQASGGGKRASSRSGSQQRQSTAQISKAITHSQIVKAVA